MISDGAWAHKNRRRYYETFKYQCFHCHAKPGKRCVTYTILNTGERTRSHISRWGALRNDN